MAYTAKALFDYDAVEDTELTIFVDDIVIVEEDNESGWCLATKRVNGADKSGWIPTDYVEKIADYTEDSSTPEPPPPPEEPPKAEEIHVEMPKPEPVKVEPKIEYKPEPVKVEPKVEPAKPAYSEPAPKAAAVAVNPSYAQFKAEAKQEAKTPAKQPDLNAQMKALNQATAAYDNNKQNKYDGERATMPKPQVVPRAGATERICHQCKGVVESAFVIAKDKTFHADHFRCDTCKQPLGGKPFIEKDDKFFCEDDYYAAFNPRCGHCGEVIKGQYISALDQSWHPDHFVCSECASPFTGNQFRKHGNKPYCEEHFRQLFAENCAKCGKVIEGQVFEALEKKFHLDCFVCEQGEHPIGEGINFHVHNGKVYCPDHFEELFMQKCSGCNKIIKGQYLKVIDNHYHPECWKCAECGIVISAENCGQFQMQFYCKPCSTVVRTRGPSNKVAQQQVVAAAKASSNTVQKAADPKPATAPAKATQSAAKPVSNAAAPAGGAFVPPSTFLSYSALKDNLFDKNEVDSSQKEMYLSDEDFVNMFKMSKSQFSAMPAWKKKQKKQEFNLF
jgi:paxillin